MSRSFIEASRSYFGLAPEQVRKVEWRTEDGRMVLAIEIRPTDKDMVGIARRMQEMPVEGQEMPVEGQDGAATARSPLGGDVMSWHAAVRRYGPEYETLTIEEKQGWGDVYTYALNQALKRGGR